MKLPNISLKSNVYVIATNHPFDDTNFISKLCDFKALEKINSLRLGNVSLNLLQEELLNRGIACAVHDDYERPFGIVAKGDEEVFECRCTIIVSCPYATRGKCWDKYRG